MRWTEPDKILFRAGKNLWEPSFSKFFIGSPLNEFSCESQLILVSVGHMSSSLTVINSFDWKLLVTSRCMNRNEYVVTSHYSNNLWLIRSAQTQCLHSTRIYWKTHWTRCLKIVLLKPTRRREIYSK